MTKLESGDIISTSNDSSSRRSSRPIWLGEDTRKWDHVRIHVQLLADRRLGAYDIAVYVGLVSHAELQSGRCFPAADTLAKYINSSAKTVRRSIRVLIDAGYLDVKREAGKASTYYVLAPPSVDSATELVVHTPDSVAKEAGLSDRAGVDSATDEQEPITRTNNKPFRFGSVPERRDGCPECNYETVIWTGDNEAEPCKCVQAS